MADIIRRAAHINIWIAAGITGDINQIATPSSRTPKKRLTDSIQGPAFGKNAPADAPKIKSGMPIPSAMENRAAAPNTTSRVWLIYSSAPANGAATQGPIISADSAPIPKTLAKCPPLKCPVSLESLLCIEFGNCSS